ncbi:MAG: uroporphyrinogen decarboxylase family protein [Bacillota bacterium]|nr:uroporphyrinogen decarboxylase family protein [Bacillota bacterium]
MRDIIDAYLNGLEITKDQLSPKERMQLFAQGKEIDRIPCCLELDEAAAPLLGFSIAEYNLCPEKICQLQDFLFTRFHPDCLTVSTGSLAMAEAMGAELEYRHSYPLALKQTAPKEVLASVRPVDVERDGRLPILLEALSLLKQKLADKVTLVGSLAAPFTVAAGLLGQANLLTALAEQPKELKQLLDCITENNESYMQRLLDLELGVHFLDPLSSLDFISLEQYREFSMPYLRKNVDYLRSRGSSCSLQIYGRSNGLWWSVKQLGISCFGPNGDEDMDTAVGILGEHMCLLGNVSAAAVLGAGSPLDVLRAARSCIRQGHDSPRGFILAADGPAPLGCSVANMQALMDAARIFGSYPLKPELWEEAGK